MSAKGDSLPNIEIARVPEEKITLYLLNLNHREGGTKADFFMLFGFTLTNWEALQSALLEHAANNPAVSIVETEFGVKYTVEGPIKCPDGRAPGIRSVWQIDHGGEVPRLLTAHPDHLS